jgi:CubicO group peptidase (beta-lactamase class C family)
VPAVTKAADDDLSAGTTTPAFAGVRRAFEDNFVARGDVGAACALYHNGDLVVDLWGGVRDRDTHLQWRADTACILFSATKGATLACVHLLVDQDRLDLDAPVALYWPEFAQEGKEAIPLRWVVTHRAGIAALDANLTLEEVLAWRPVVEAVARQRPNWVPGTATGYHARTFGWILGEVVRRVTGQTLGRFFAETIALPLKLSTWIGLPQSELARVAILLSDPDPEVHYFDGDSLGVRVLSGPSNLFTYGPMWNNPRLWKAEMPSSNGISDARSLARMYAAMIGSVDGQRIFGPGRLAAATTLQVEDTDIVLDLPVRLGEGFQLGERIAPGVASTAFGHAGAGGTTAWADPAVGLSFAYVTNQMRLTNDGGNVRAGALVDAAYAAVNDRRPPVNDAAV